MNPKIKTKNKEDSIDFLMSEAGVKRTPRIIDIGYFTKDEQGRKHCTYFSEEHNRRIKYVSENDICTDELGNVWDDKDIYIDYLNENDREI